MSARRPRRKFNDDEESHPDERWMASYMDMVTVLMCMFIVLFAMSTVDANKFEKLRNSLATGFGAVEVGKIDTAEGVVVPAEKIEEDGEGTVVSTEEVEETVEATPDDEPKKLTDMERARLEVEDLRALREKIRAGLKEEDLAHAVRFQLDERGLTIRLIGTQTFFKPDKAFLTTQTLHVLDEIGPVVADTDYGVSVEGHTAELPPSYKYPLHWELSSERAVNVVRHLTEMGGVAPEHIAAVGFGESRPLTDGSTPEKLAMNRRVDIVVLSDEPENVRSLIPQIVAEK